MPSHNFDQCPSKAKGTYVRERGDKAFIRLCGLHIRTVWAKGRVYIRVSDQTPVLLVRVQRVS